MCIIYYCKTTLLCASRLYVGVGLLRRSQKYQDTKFLLFMLMSNDVPDTFEIILMINVTCIIISVTITTIIVLRYFHLQIHA